MGEGVSADGSPVPVYLALPFGETPRIIHREVRPGGTILELGCGVGRITRPLVALGHPVVAVDDSVEMLAHVTGAETVQGDLFGLQLGRTFDGVVGGSHLIDAPERERRLALLEVCRRHVADDGVVLLERYEPDWVRDPADSEGVNGLVELEFRVLARHEATFDAAITYRVGDRSWTQTFTVAAVDDDQLARDAEQCGLRFDRWLDDRCTWGLLTPSGG